MKNNKNSILTICFFSLFLSILFTGCTEIGIKTGEWYHIDEAASSIKITGLILGLQGNSAFTEFWFEWKNDDSIIKLEAENVYRTSFSSIVENLDRLTCYQYRAVAKDKDNSAYHGNWIDCIPGQPEIDTKPVSNYGLNWVELQSDIIHLGGAPSCKTNFLYGISEQDLKMSTPIKYIYSTGSFGEKIYDLTPGETYYYQARVENDAGIVIGDILECYPGKPQISTINASNIEKYSATLNGYLVHTGGALCEVRFQYKFENGSYRATQYFNMQEIGYYKTSVELTSNTKYYYYAEVYNPTSNWHVKGEILTFTTKS